MNSHTVLKNQSRVISALCVTTLVVTSLTNQAAEVTHSLSAHVGGGFVYDNTGSKFVDTIDPESGVMEFTSSEASLGFSTNALSARLYAEARYEAGYLPDPDSKASVNIRDLVTIGHGLHTGMAGIMRIQYNITGDLDNQVDMTPPAGSYGQSDWSLRTQLTGGGLDETRGGQDRTDTGASGDAIPAGGLMVSFDIPITFGTLFEFHRTFKTNAMIDSQGQDLGTASWKIGAYLQYTFSYMGADFFVSDGGGGFDPVDKNDISVSAASGADYRFAGTDPTIIPEPSSLVMIVVGCALIGLRRRPSSY